MPKRRRICFVTGSRAEFGLMESTLRAIRSHPGLKLQIIATGMHLDPTYGKPLSALFDAGFKPTETVRWSLKAGISPVMYSFAAGSTMTLFGLEYEHLKPHIVLLVGDRVEIFAAAAAAHLMEIPVAHVHGGDRALGHLDDTLRHVITKLSHIHFPATKASAQRLARLGEDEWRIKMVGSPGLDGIQKLAAPWSQFARLNPSLEPRRYAILLFHPASSDLVREAKVASDLFPEILGAGFDHVVILFPNNDPGSRGIRFAWASLEKSLRRDSEMCKCATVVRDLPRPQFLGLLRDAAVLIGNSSAGIIEAASFGTPVINIGDRQKGRERNANVIDVPANAAAIRRALKKVWNNGRPIRFPKKNIYGSGRTSEKIAHILANIPLDERLRRKLIAY